MEYIFFCISLKFIYFSNNRHKFFKLILPLILVAQDFLFFVLFHLLTSFWGLTSVQRAGLQVVLNSGFVLTSIVCKKNLIQVPKLQRSQARLSPTFQGCLLSPCSCCRLSRGGSLSWSMLSVWWKFASPALTKTKQHEFQGYFYN